MTLSDPQAALGKAVQGRVKALLRLFTRPPPEADAVLQLDTHPKGPG
jgi:hypothetical protein